MSRFRKEYRELSIEQRQLVENLKTTAEDFEDLLTTNQGATDGRSHALAMTKLQEAVFWAVHSVT